MDEEAIKRSSLSPSLGGTHSLHYEALVDLASPHPASVFESRKRLEVLGNVPGQVMMGAWEDGTVAMTASPLEVLDRLVQQGSDAHDRVLKRSVEMGCRSTVPAKDVTMHQKLIQESIHFRHDSNRYSCLTYRY